MRVQSNKVSEVSATLKHSCTLFPLNCIGLLTPLKSTLTATSGLNRSLQRTSFLALCSVTGALKAHCVTHLPHYVTGSRADLR